MDVYFKKTNIGLPLDSTNIFEQIMIQRSFCSEREKMIVLFSLMEKAVFFHFEYLP